MGSSCRKGLVTNVSGPQRNVCPGTLTPLAKGWLPYPCVSAQKLSRVGVAGRNRPAEEAGERRERLETGRRFPPRSIKVTFQKASLVTSAQ